MLGKGVIADGENLHGTLFKRIHIAIEICFVLACSILKQYSTYHPYIVAYGVQLLTGYVDIIISLTLTSVDGLCVWEPHKIYYCACKPDMPGYGWALSCSTALRIRCRQVFILGGCPSYRESDMSVKQLTGQLAKVFRVIFLIIYFKNTFHYFN